MSVSDDSGASAAPKEIHKSNGQSKRKSDDNISNVNEKQLTPFMLFCAEHRASLLEAHPAAEAHVLGRMLGEHWETLPNSRRKEYTDMSDAMSSGKEAVKQKTKKAKKDPNAPKNAASAYMFYSKHIRPLIKREHADATFGELGKLVGARWKAATPEERARFEQQALEDKQRYNEAMSAYKNKKKVQSATAQRIATEKRQHEKEAADRAAAAVVAVVAEEGAKVAAQKSN